MKEQIKHAAVKATNVITLQLHLDSEKEMREEAQAEIADLKEEIFCPGIFKCAKCGFKLIAKIIDTASGNIGMNRKPQECSNGCGPMWKVTWKERAKEAFKAVDKLFEEKQSYKAQADKLAEALECNTTFHRLGGIDDCEPCKALEAYAKFKEGK